MGHQTPRHWGLTPITPFRSGCQRSAAAAACLPVDPGTLGNSSGTVLLYVRYSGTGTGQAAGVGGTVVLLLEGGGVERRGGGAERRRGGAEGGGVLVECNRGGCDCIGAESGRRMGEEGRP